MAVERSTPRRRPIPSTGTPRQSPPSGEARGPKAQRGDAKKGTPALPERPKVDVAAVRADGLAAARANAFALDLLAASVARAVVKAQNITLPPSLAAFHQALTDVPVTIVLKRGDDSLRGCLPKDRTERRTVDTFLDMLPMHIEAMGSERFCDELRAKLTQMLDGPRVLDDLWLGTTNGVYELAVMRVSAAGQAARADEAKVALADAFRGGAASEPGKLSQELLLRPYAEADQSVIYGVLLALEPMGLVAKPDVLAATGLSADQLKALAAGHVVDTHVPRDRVVAGMLRALMAQPRSALAQWRRYIPASEAEVKSLLRRLAPPGDDVSSKTDTPRQHVAWSVAPMFARVLDGLSRTDQELVMGVVYARLRTGDFPTCKDVIGVTAEELDALISSGKVASPMPPLHILDKIFSMFGKSNDLPEQWFDYVAIDRKAARDLWKRLADLQASRVEKAARSRGPEGTYVIDGKTLFGSVRESDRAVVNECLNALMVNAFANSDVIYSMTAMTRDDLRLVLTGGTARASIPAKELIALALRYVACTEIERSLWYMSMTFSREEVIAAGRRYAP